MCGCVAYLTTSQVRSSDLMSLCAVDEIVALTSLHVSGGNYRCFLGLSAEVGIGQIWTQIPVVSLHFLPLSLLADL